MSTISVKVSLDFVKMTVETKLEFGEKVIGKLTDGATTFPNCTVPVADLETRNSNLRNALKDWLNNPSLVEALKRSEKAWIADFLKDAKYVDSIAGGNAAIIDLSGYNKTKDTRVKLSIPATPVVKSSKSIGKGELEAKMVKQTDARMFLAALYTPNFKVTFNENQVLFTIENADGTISQAAIAITQKRKAKFTGIKSKADMKLQATAINSKGMGIPTPPSDNGIL
jgi:hypothetical protein